jgi:hypothetical protein
MSTYGPFAPALPVPPPPPPDLNAHYRRATARALAIARGAEPEPYDDMMRGMAALPLKLQLDLTFVFLILRKQCVATLRSQEHADVVRLDTMVKAVFKNALKPAARLVEVRSREHPARVMEKRGGA